MNKEDVLVPAQVNLLPEDRSLLGAMCQVDRRPAAYQVSWLIREYARQRGLLANANRASEVLADPSTAAQ